MARRKNKRKRQKQRDQQNQSSVAIKSSADFTEVESEIRELLERKKAREAVKQAKEAHKHFDTEQSEALLASAYKARIKEMFERGMVQESNSLLGLVAERHPSHAQVWQSIRNEQNLRSGNYDDLVRPLAEPDLAPERRKAIETQIRHELFDLSSLAETRALPDGHPLRCAAAALSKAFTAVTTGPVGETEIALPEISRRSPLAPWKLIIRAIAHFYCGQDVECGQCLDAVDPSSAPARLAGRIRHMLEGKAKGDGPAGDLHAAVSEGSDPVYRVFKKLDDALQNGDMYDTTKMMAYAEKACKRHHPDLLQQVSKRIVVRGFMEGFSLSSMRKEALTEVEIDADYFRLLARASEEVGDEPQANEFWDEFRRAAIREGLFEDNSPEAAAIYLHMGSVIQGVTESELRGAARFYINRDDETPYYLELEQLYKRSCTIDPQPESFAQWLDAVRESEWQVSDRAAQAWHEALPKDSRPLLFLMKSCEERKALRKALKYLEQAEAAESMNPDVRRARLRLWFSTAERHLGQKKPHLARKDFDEIEKLPQLEGDRVAYLRALQMICSALEDDLPETNRISDDLKAEYGSAFRYILYRRASTIAKLDCIDVESEYALPICKEISRALELSRDLEKPFETSHAMEGVVLQELQQDKCALDSPSLFLVAETIAESSVFYDSSVAFHASLHGLGRKDELQACFMLLRALSLRYDLSMRAAECAAAAVLMARRRGDTTLAGKAIDLLEDICNMECLDFEAELEDAEYQLKHIIDRETSAKQLTQQTPVKLLRIVPNGRKDTDSPQPDETHEEERGRQGERETRRGDKERGNRPRSRKRISPFCLSLIRTSFIWRRKKRKRKHPKPMMTTRAWMTKMIRMMTRAQIMTSARTKKKKWKPWAGLTRC